MRITTGWLDALLVLAGAALVVTATTLALTVHVLTAAAAGTPEADATVGRATGALATAVVWSGVLVLLAGAWHDHPGRLSRLIAAGFPLATGALLALATPGTGSTWGQALDGVFLALAAITLAAGALLLACSRTMRQAAAGLWRGTLSTAVIAALAGGALGLALATAG